MVGASGNYQDMQLSHEQKQVTESCGMSKVYILVWNGWEWRELAVPSIDKNSFSDLFSTKYIRDKIVKLKRNLELSVIASLHE